MPGESSASTGRCARIPVAGRRPHARRLPAPAAARQRRAPCAPPGSRYSRRRGDSPAWRLLHTCDPLNSRASPPPAWRAPLPRCQRLRPGDQCAQPARRQSPRARQCGPVARLAPDAGRGSIRLLLLLQRRAGHSIAGKFRSSQGVSGRGHAIHDLERRIAAGLGGLGNPRIQGGERLWRR